MRLIKNKRPIEAADLRLTLFDRTTVTAVRDVLRRLRAGPQPVLKSRGRLSRASPTKTGLAINLSSHRKRPHQ